MFPHLKNVFVLNIRFLRDVNVIQDWGCPGDVADIDDLLKSHLEVRDDLDDDGELDAGPTGRGDTEGDIVCCPLVEEGTEPLLVFLGPAKVQ